MSDLGSDEREYLASFFAEHSPSPVDAQAALARVRQRVDRGADVVVLAEAPTPPPVGNSRPWLKVAVVGLAAAAAVLLFLQFDLQSMILSETSDGEQQQAVYGDAADPSVTGGEVVERTPKPKKAVIAPPKVEPAPIPEEEVAPIEPVKPPPPKKPKKKNGSDATLHAELTLLRPAQKALRSGNNGRALTLFNDHAKSFPKSAFAEERAFGRVEALCGLGRLEQARKALAKAGRKFPGSPRRHRAKEACESKEAP